MKIPREFLFFSEENSGDFLRLGICTYKLFFRFVYTDAQVGWDCKGTAGSLPAFVAAFTKHQAISESDLDEMQRMIDRIRRGESK